MEAVAVRPQRPQAPLATAAGCVLILFLVLLPKGGIRVPPGIPLTWGYLFLGIFAVTGLMVRVAALPLRLPPMVLATFLILLPMFSLFLYAGFFYGIWDLPFTVSNFVGLFGLPATFLLIFAPFFPLLDGVRLARWFRACVFYAAAYGIFLFFLHPLTGHFIEIPYVTVNAADYGDLETTKSIARGFFLKLISTYNNGNLYGVSTLIILPMYMRLESSWIRRMTVRLALLLTLSRTVWVGLILYEMLPLLHHLLRQVKTFPVLYLGAARRRLVGVLLTMTLVFGSVAFTTSRGHYLQFLLDRSLGNRADQIQNFENHLTLLPEMPLHGFSEILYTSAGFYWGISGFFAFLLIMISPLLFFLWDPSVMRYPMRQAALKGLVIYMVLAAGDGALDYIPVMAFYWFTFTVFLCDWPGELSRLMLKAQASRGSLPAGGAEAVAAAGG